MSSLPVVLCAKDSAVARPAMQKYLPEVDVVHVCHTLESAKHEIPQLLKGQAIAPSSGLGSNVERESQNFRAPLAAISGGAFTLKEFESLMREDVKSVPWLKIEISNVPMSERPPNPSYATTVVTNVKRCLQEHGLLGEVPSTDNEDEIWTC